MEMTRSARRLHWVRVRRDGGRYVSRWGVLGVPTPRGLRPGAYPRVALISPDLPEEYRDEVRRKVTGADGAPMYGASAGLVVFFAVVLLVLVPVVHAPQVVGLAWQPFWAL